MIGAKLKKIRISLGLTQSDFAAKLGIRQGHLSEIEREKKKPGAELLVMLKQAFPNIRLDYIVGDDMMFAKPTDISHHYDNHGCTPELVCEQVLDKDYGQKTTTIRANGPAMCVEGIQEGDDLFIVIGAKPPSGHLVLYMQDNAFRIKRWKTGDPDPYAICIHLMRRLI